MWRIARTHHCYHIGGMEATRSEVTGNNERTLSSSAFIMVIIVIVPIVNSVIVNINIIIIVVDKHFRD